jgi:hypothetical protein
LLYGGVIGREKQYMNRLEFFCDGELRFSVRCTAARALSKSGRGKSTGAIK